MHRTDFIKATATALATAVIDQPAFAQAPRPRMNLLFITADDMYSSIPGFMGNRHHLTPNLDTLAAASHRFKHNRTTAAIC
jgi:N-sulfoglucosamine sulfohydrolase